MSDNFRQPMSWLHTWSGLILGWLLFAIFVTGTSAYYKQEITLWMQPELHKSIKSEKTLDVAMQKAMQLSSKLDTTSIYLPNSRANTIRVFLPNTSKNKENASKKRRRGVLKHFDASTGEELKLRQTAGGNFLYRFHFELYSFPRSQGRLIVALATMIMFIAIITGVIIHKRIFKDIFTFRPKAGPRGWMDAHIIPAVATLPFLLMITYSGLLHLNNSLLPWSMKTLFDGDFRTYKQEIRSLKNKDEITSKKQVAKKEEKVLIKASSEPSQAQKIFNARLNRDLQVARHSNFDARKVSNIQRIISANTRRNLFQNRTNTKIKEESLTKAKLETILLKANKIWPNNIGYFSIIKKANSVQVEVLPENPSTIFNFKGDRESALYDGKTTAIIKKSVPPFTSSVLMNTYYSFLSLHMVHFADSNLRFIFFIFGLAGVVLIGTGLMLWIKKREYKNSKKKSLGFWLVEKLNLGTIMGLMLAIAAYFIVNRLIGIETENRRLIEINTFFIVWLLSYLHALVRETSKAWMEQLWFAIRIYIFIPILNAIVVFGSFSQIFNRDSILINFDLFFIFTALVLALILMILKRKAKIRKIDGK